MLTQKTFIVASSLHHWREDLHETFGCFHLPLLVTPSIASQVTSDVCNQSTNHTKKCFFFVQSSLTAFISCYDKLEVYMYKNYGIEKEKAMTSLKEVCLPTYNILSSSTEIVMSTKDNRINQKSANSI